jgi:transcriptional regulator GlxA family with amidase domain
MTPSDITRDAKATASRSNESPEIFGFLLIPQFSMLGFTSAVEPLRSANRLAGRRLYQWQLITEDGRPVVSSSDIEVVPHAGLDRVARLAQLIVVAGIDAHRYQNRKVLSALRRLARRGCSLGAVSTGTYLLARAGLLSGYRATIHWENLASFREEFPDLEITSELFEIDRDRVTCSGGTAALDLMLSLIGRTHGRTLATQVAEQFLHERIRDTRDPQRMTLRNRLGVSHPKLLTVAAEMEANLEEPLARAELARRAELSSRQLERLFSTWRWPAASSRPPTSPNATASTTTRPPARSACSRIRRPRITGGDDRQVRQITVVACL